MACLISLIGCSPAPRNHYVRTAEASIASIPLVPAVNRHDVNRSATIALRAEYRSPSRLELPIQAVTEKQPDPGGHLFRSRYKVNQGPIGVGLEWRQSPHRIIDWFVTGSANADATFRGAVLVGAGLTLPLPFANLRIAPAVGLHAYATRTEDSTIARVTNIFSDSTYTDTLIYQQDDRYSRVGTLRSISVSLWPPNKVDRAWTPYLHYQVHWRGMSANDSDNSVPRKVIELRGHTMAIGMDYVLGKTFIVNARLSRESMNNGFGSDASYRIETGLGVRLPTRAR